MKPIRLGGTEGVAGRSSTWEIKRLGGVRRVPWQELRRGLRSGRYSGVESVRRIDGDWGPLFGRPMYREVFSETQEPRDHAKAREGARIARLRRWIWASLGIAVLSVLVSILLAGSQILLLVGLASGITAGLLRLQRTMHVHDLSLLIDRTAPPVLQPPPIVDWQKLAEEDRKASELQAE